jgi:hypothetical protein
MGLFHIIYHQFKLVEYSQLYYNDDNYQDWAKNWKTVIILNGGTSETMKLHLESLKSAGIKQSSFNEPDLNDMLTGITFIVDERVFNKEKYPDFLKFVENRAPSWFYNKNSKIDIGYENNELFKTSINNLLINPFYPIYNIEFFKYNRIKKSEINLMWNDWINYIGGVQNVFLRKFLEKFKLASN